MKKIRLVATTIFFALFFPSYKCYEDLYELRYTRTESEYCEDLAFQKVGKQGCENFTPEDRDRFGIDVLNCVYDRFGQRQIKCGRKEVVDKCKERMDEDQNYHVHTFGVAVYERHCKSLSMKFLIPGLKAMKDKFDATLAKWRQGAKDNLKSGKKFTRNIIDSVADMDAEEQRSKESAALLEQATRASIKHFGKSHEEVAEIVKSLQFSVSEQQQQQRLSRDRIGELMEVLEEIRKLNCGYKKPGSLTVMEALMLLSIDYLLIVAIPLAIDERYTLRRRLAYWLSLGFIPSVVFCKVDVDWLSSSIWLQESGIFNKFGEVNDSLIFWIQGVASNGVMILKRMFQVVLFLYTTMYALSIIATGLLPFFIRFVFSLA